MLWVTRPRPHIDRTACAWLFPWFIDPEAFQSLEAPGLDAWVQQTPP